MWYSLNELFYAWQTCRFVRAAYGVLGGIFGARLASNSSSSANARASRYKRHLFNNNRALFLFTQLAACAFAPHRLTYNIAANLKTYSAAKAWRSSKAAMVTNG